MAGFVIQSGLCIALNRWLSDPQTTPMLWVHFWVHLLRDTALQWFGGVTSPMPQGGSRKRGTFGAWFSEPPNKELAIHANDYQHDPIFLDLALLL